MNNLEAFFDIYDFYYIPWWQTRPFIYAAVIFGFIVAALLSYFVARYIRSKRKRELLPWEWAQQELKTLSPQNLVEKHEFKKFYVGLIEILKKYLLLRFGWHLSTCTDEEVITFVKKHDQDMATQLESIVNGARMIKFANQHALHDKANEELKNVLGLVGKTKKHEEKT